MDWIESKSLGFLLPASADEFIGSEVSESLQSFGEVVGSDEVAEVASQLLMAVVVVALNGGLLDDAVHALNLTVGPGMIGFGQAMFDAVQKTDPVKRVTTEASGRPSAVLRQVGELNAVVGEHSVDHIRNGRDQCFQEGRGGSHVGAFNQLHEGELRDAVDGNKEVELALGGAHLRQIDMELANRIAFELLPARLAAFHFRQPADAMPRQTAM